MLEIVLAVVIGNIVTLAIVGLGFLLVLSRAKAEPIQQR